MHTLKALLPLPVLLALSLASSTRVPAAVPRTILIEDYTATW